MTRLVGCTNAGSLKAGGWNGSSMEGKVAP